MAYLLDADAFIRAKNLHYGFEICPGFWDQLNFATGLFSPTGIIWNALNARTFLDAFSTEDPPRPDRTAIVDCVIDIEAIYEKHGSILVSHVISLF